MVNKTGRDDWIRTSDLTHPKRARYQAAPRPVCTDLTILPKKNCQTCGATHVGNNSQALLTSRDSCRTHTQLLTSATHATRYSRNSSLFSAALGFLLEEGKQFAQFGGELFQRLSLFRC